MEKLKHQVLGGEKPSKPEQPNTSKVKVLGYFGKLAVFLSDRLEARKLKQHDREMERYWRKKRLYERLRRRIEKARAARFVSQARKESN